MPRFVIERDPGVLTQEKLKGIAGKIMELQKKRPGIQWIRSYISEVDGKVYCEYEATSLEAMVAFNKELGAPTVRISQVAQAISPEMFR